MNMRLPSGLAAVPDTWIPQGRSRGPISSPMGQDQATVDRTQDKIFMNPDSALAPDITISNLGNGRIRILADMTWPLPDLKVEGTADRQGEIVLFKEDKGGTRTGEITQQANGSVQTVLHQPGKEDVWFVYTPK